MKTTLVWIRENPARWDEDKARIVGGAAPGIFDPRYRRLELGKLVPSEWWRAEEPDGRVVGYGWLDMTWGDAEILLATAPEARGHGVGSFVLEMLEAEARARGLRYLNNVVHATHPHGADVTAWLEKRGFRTSEDGRLLRSVIAARR